MTRASAMWERWASVWDGTESATPMAIFRILVGLTFAWVWGTILWSGAAEVIFVTADHGGLAPRGRGWDSFAWVTGESPASVVASIWAAFSLAWLLVCGIGGRWTALCLGQLSMALFAVHPGTGGGHDRLLLIACWVLFLSGAHQTLGVGARWRHGSWWPVVAIPSWPRRLLVLQLVVMYTVTGLNKGGEAWSASSGYAAVYRAMLNPSWAKLDPVVIGWVAPLLSLGTWVSWWWEVLWMGLGAQRVESRLAATAGRPVAWWARWDLRAPLAAIGVVVHGALWAFMNLGPFSPITLAYYVGLWHPGEVAARGLSGLAKMPRGEAAT